MNYDKLTKELLDDMFLKRPPARPIFDLSKGEMGTMLYLVKENDHAVAGDISKRVQLTSGRMASVLKSLEKKGLITKRQCEKDKRQTIVSATDKGRDIVEEHSKHVFEHVKNMLKFLGDEDAETYVKINKRIYSNFDPNKKY